MGAWTLRVPVTLPCSGRTMPNRLTKVALYEHLADMYGGPPNQYHIGLYSEWAKHDWGMIITGNVQVSREHLTLGRDMVVPEVLNEHTLAPFKKLAEAIQGRGLREASTRPLAIAQLSHVGRQSPNVIGGRRFGVPPIAPSPVRVGSNKRVLSSDGTTYLDSQDTPHPFMLFLFPQPKEMALPDIRQVQQAFVRGALTALEAGFDGIQLHSAHGYLLAQFLNPKSNVRQDDYSVRSDKGLRMLHEIVKGVRAVVPKNFVIGVKINSADYVESGETPSDKRVLEEAQRVLDHVHTIALWEVFDFIEISGGDYESPDFMSSKATSPRQAFFAQFAKKAREGLKTNIPTGTNIPLILLTGGLRSPAHLQSALDAGHSDLLGIGRGSILRPDIPTILHERISKAAVAGTSIASDDEPFAHEPDGDLRGPSWLPRIPLAGAGINISWYSVRMRQIAASQFEKGIDGTVPPAPLPTYEMSGTQSLVRMWVWVDGYKLLLRVLSVFGMGVVLVAVYHMINFYK